MREQFEVRFPVPAGIQWSDEHQNYGWIKKTAFQRTITYRALWTGWQESRTALVIERPEKCEFAEPDGPYHRGYRQGVRNMVDAIEAAGLKVKA